MKIGSETHGGHILLSWHSCQPFGYVFGCALDEIQSLWVRLRLLCVVNEVARDLLSSYSSSESSDVCDKDFVTRQLDLA